MSHSRLGAEGAAPIGDSDGLGKREKREGRIMIVPKTDAAWGPRRCPAGQAKRVLGVM